MVRRNSHQYPDECQHTRFDTKKRLHPLDSREGGEGGEGRQGVKNNEQLVINQQSCLLDMQESEEQVRPHLPDSCMTSNQVDKQ